MFAWRVGLLIDRNPVQCCAEHEGMIVLAARVATGMPYDMLGLPDAVNAVMTAMQQQQLQ